MRKTNSEDMSKLFLTTMSMLKECMRKFPIEFCTALMNLDEGTTITGKTFTKQNNIEEEENEED